MQTELASLLLASLLIITCGFRGRIGISRLSLMRRGMSPPDLPEASIEGISAPASVRTSSFRELEQLQQQQQDFDYIVIGSGIGGLSAAAMLSQCYKYKVLVLESHYLLGGCAHSFERGGFKFDAGPSLWNGMNSKPYNPLREVMEIVGVGDKVQYADYDGWVMHTPNNVSFKFKVGEGEFEKVIGQYGGDDAMREWKRLNEYLKPIQQLAVAIPPLVLRSDPAVLLTLAPHFGKLLKGAAVASKVEGSFLDVSKDIVNDPFLVNWFEFLSFALSGMPADSTIAAAVAYTMRDLHQKGAKLDYPIGGSAAVVQALAEAITGGTSGSRIIKNAHVGQIDIDARGRAVGVTMKKGVGIRFRAKKAVISNASIWDTATLLPASLPAVSDDRRRRELEARLTALKEEKLATPMTNSFVHLHVGINASGLPPDLESHYSVINTWDDIEAPQNHVIISIPSVLDPGLAPDGCHVIHAYAAANEPYDLYSQHAPRHSRGSSKSDPQEQEQEEEVNGRGGGGGGGGGGGADYIALKADRCDFLWKAIERSIPDVRERTILKLEGTPLTHKRFNRRYKGTYGPRLRAGKESFPYPKDLGIDGLLMCGDSVFPGIGVPAVAASGANAASSSVSVWEQLKMLDKLYAI